VVAGSKQRSTMKRFLSLIKFMVAAGRDKCEAGRVASGKVNARSDPPHPRCFAKRVRKLLKIKECGREKIQSQSRTSQLFCLYLLAASCSLFALFFRARILYFQQFTDSFCKHRGGGGSLLAFTLPDATLPASQLVPSRCYHELYET